MSVLDACVTYLFMYTQYLFLHVKIIWEKKKHPAFANKANPASPGFPGEIS